MCLSALLPVSANLQQMRRRRGSAQRFVRSVLVERSRLLGHSGQCAPESLRSKRGAASTRLHHPSVLPVCLRGRGTLSFAHRSLSAGGGLHVLRCVLPVCGRGTLSFAHRSLTADMGGSMSCAVCSPCACAGGGLGLLGFLSGRCPGRDWRPPCPPCHRAALIPPAAGGLCGWHWRSQGSD